MFIFDNCNIMQEMWVLIFDCQLSLYSTAQVENFLKKAKTGCKTGCFFVISERYIYPNSFTGP